MNRSPFTPNAAWPAAWAATLLCLALPVAHSQGVPAGRGATTFEYDADGSVTKMTDGIGGMEERQYDPLGRLKKTTLPTPAEGRSRGVINLEYAPSGEVSTTTDPRRLVTRSPSNGLGEVKNVQSPDTGRTDFTYYKDGKIHTSADARSLKTTYEYDEARRLKLITYASGTPTEFEYDGGASPPNLNAVGKLSKVTDESGNTKYEYDGFGRLKKKTQFVKIDDKQKTFSTEYFRQDPNCPGKISSIRLPSGVKANFKYSAYCLVSEITANPLLADGSGPDTSQEVALLDIMQWKAQSSLDPATFELNDWRWTQSFDRDSVRKISVAGYGVSADLGKIDYVFQGGGHYEFFQRKTFYDDAGRPSNYEYHTSPGVKDASKDEVFRFDGESRLVDQIFTATSYGYDYDANGNRTKVTINASPFKVTVDPANSRLLSSEDAEGKKDYEYELTGQIKKIKGGSNPLTFTYSDRGRMASVTTPKGVVKYVYNGHDQRVAKSGPTALVDDGARYFVYDDREHLLGEYKADGKAAYEIIYAGDTPVVAITFSGTQQVKTTFSNIYTDHLNTPRVIMGMVTNSDGSTSYKTRWRWNHGEAFGNSPPEENPESVGVYVFNPRFPGQVSDRETGLYYNNFRLYSPKLGRYIESDPIGLAGGINTYNYVSANPLDNADPLGLKPGYVFPKDAFRSPPPKCSCGNVSDLISHARKDDRDWSKQASREDINRGFKKDTYKCNLFADTMFEETGFHLPNNGGNHIGTDTENVDGLYPPGAWNLSDPNYKVPNWPVVVGPPQAGDLAAYDSHVGIVSGPDTTISASPNGKIENDWGFRKGQKPVFRRCTCN